MNSLITLELLPSDDAGPTILCGMVLNRNGICLGKIGTCQLDKGRLLSTALEYFSEIGVKIDFPSYMKSKPVKPPEKRKIIVKRKKA